MKRLIAFFKDPPVWFALLWVLLTGGLIALSAKVSSSAAEEEPFAPVLYGFTALSLSYAIYAAVKWVPKVKLAAKTRLSRNKYAGTFLASYTVRTVVYSSLSTLFDFAYVVVNGVTAIVYHSVWYYALAAYYFALMVIRLFVILCAGQGLKKYGKESRAFDERKLNIYLVSGVALLLLEASLSGVITLMIVLPKETQTGFVLAIANAAYIFTRVILAIVNKIKSGKKQEPVTQALRNLNLTDALVSLFSLQITLSAAVGGDLPPDERARRVCGVLLHRLPRHLHDLRRRAPKEETLPPCRLFCSISRSARSRSSALRAARSRRRAFRAVSPRRRSLPTQDKQKVKGLPRKSFCISMSF